MKIAFFVTAFPTLSETFIANQVIALQQSGHLVHIFSQQKPVTGPVHQMITEAGLSGVTFYLDDIPQSRISKVFTLVRKILLNPFNKNIPGLFKAVLNNQSALSVYNFIPFIDKPCYNVLHAHFGQNGNYVIQLRTLGLYKNARFITTFHGYDLDHTFAKNDYYTSLFNNCHLFTVNSLYSKNLLLQLGCNEDKVHLLPVGLDIKKFKPVLGIKEAADAPLQILFAGRLIEFKAPDRVIEICKLLKINNRTRFRAVIIGDGVMLPILEKLLDEYDLNDEVKIEGPKTQEEIISIMEHSDIFLYPGITYNGRAENQGLVIQEAQAMQLPVLVSDAGGMSEGVMDGVTGFVLPENDLAGFAEKIELLAANADLREKMGEAGRRFVESKYNIEILNKELLRLYQN